MYVPFDTLPDESRIWIYQSSRKFQENEIALITNRLEQFIAQWAAHGKPLAASFTISYNRFIIISVNEEEQHVTGCSIDASVGVIQELEKELKVELLDKLNVTFKLGEFIVHKSILDFKQMVKDKAVSDQTIVFNNLVNTIGEWRDFWEVPATESWHKRFF
jgi:hypothetical protein